MYCAHNKMFLNLKQPLITSSLTPFVQSLSAMVGLFLLGVEIESIYMYKFLLNEIEDLGVQLKRIIFAED